MKNCVRLNYNNILQRLHQGKKSHEQTYGVWVFLAHYFICARVEIFLLSTMIDVRGFFYLKDHNRSSWHQNGRYFNLFLHIKTNIFNINYFKAQQIALKLEKILAQHHTMTIRLEGDETETTLWDWQECWMQENMHVDVGFGNISSFCVVQHQEAIVDNYIASTTRFNSNTSRENGHNKGHNKKKTNHLAFHYIFLLGDPNMTTWRRFSHLSLWFWYLQTMF